MQDLIQLRLKDLLKEANRQDDLWEDLKQESKENL